MDPAELLSAYDSQLREEAEVVRATVVERQGPLMWAQFDDEGFVTYRSLDGVEGVALDALIRETLARARGRGSASSFQALLFLGSRDQAFPALVVRNRILEPVDKLVWMVIQHSARGTASRALFPSYADIARFANVSSTSTVSRAIAILRATRWLSLWARSRNNSGRFGGNVYALHNELLPLVDAVHLDPGYPVFEQYDQAPPRPRATRGGCDLEITR